MMETENTRISENDRNNQVLTLDAVPSSQPELGPSIPDGGYGWLVYISNLFFQILIPSLLVSFGIFVAFMRLENGTSRNKNPNLWEEEIIKIPLFHIIFKTLLDTPMRSLASTVIWPRLVATSGICLTCAGLLFLWIGMTGNDDHWIYSWAGILTGIGASLLLTQSEIIVGQYFRLKLPILTQISYIAMTLGFIVCPIILSQEILKKSLAHILLWYQAIIIQGLVLSLFYRLPLYLKQKPLKSYRFLSLVAGDDEEDIFSKNSKELQIKRQNSETVRKIEIDIEQPSTSQTTTPKHWVNFNDDENDDEQINNQDKSPNFSDYNEISRQNWERFDDGNDNVKTLADELNEEEEQPSSLFSDLPVNNNNTYSFDEAGNEYHTSNVFAPNNSITFSDKMKQGVLPLKEPTFYKTLLTNISNKYSTFVFFSLYPSFLYVEADNVQMDKMGELVGFMAIGPMCFYAIVFFMKTSKKANALFFALYNTLSFVGYFMISDTNVYAVMLCGGALVSFSIFAIDYYGKSLNGLSLKGEFTQQYTIISCLTGFSLFLFYFLDVTYRSCFRLMAIFQFFVGALWLANFIYNKIRVT